jgi:hypothetical protein
MFSISNGEWAFLITFTSILFYHFKTIVNATIIVQIVLIKFLTSFVSALTILGAFKLLADGRLTTLIKMQLLHNDL